MSSQELTPGTRIADRYVVESVLASGGMAVVVAALRLDSDDRVAIKCLLPAALRRPEIVERFRREAHAAAAMRGEHIVRFIEAGTLADGAPYLVLEYLEGRDLGQLIEESSPVPLVDAVRYVLEACEALAEVHAANIIHRDLKPSNLFLADRPHGPPIVKLLDFGISKIPHAANRVVTKTSAVMGTPEYMSPEQLVDAKRVDQRADIWSLGVILYELIAGSPPFIGADMAATIARILRNRPEPLRSLRSDVAPELEAVVLQCLSSQPVDRFWDVGELAAALAPHGPPESRGSAAAAATLLEVARRSMVVEEPVAPTRADRRRVLLAVVIGVLFACVIAFAFALFTKS